MTRSPSGAIGAVTSQSKRIVYKVLDKDGRAPFTKFRWPLPTEDGPGEWLELPGAPILCRYGFHGYLDPDHGDIVYEMEVDGRTVEDDVKIAATRARLLRRHPPLMWVPQRVEQGDEICVQCGKRHWSYTVRPRLAPQWSDPDDGHSYYRVSTMGDWWPKWRKF